MLNKVKKFNIINLFIDLLAKEFELYKIFKI